MDDDPRMQPVKALRRLVELKETHENLKKTWDKFLKLLQENVSLQQVDYSETSLPKIEISDDSGYRFHFYFTETPVFCEFKQYNEWGVLCFGYQKKDLERRYIDKITETVFFDHNGNIHKRVDSDPEGTNIAMKRFPEAIFPRILRALEESMKEIEGQK